MLTLITETVKWLMVNYPLVLAVLSVIAFVGGFVRGFDLGSFHWPGFTDLWRLNGDRKRHEYKIDKAYITFSERGLAKEDRKWRRRVRDVQRDLHHHKIKIEFHNNVSISKEYIAMWRMIVVQFSSSCYFDFEVLGGSPGQSKLIDMLLDLKYNMIREGFERTGILDMDVPLAVHTSVSRAEAPNKQLLDYIRDKEVIK